MRHYLVTLAIAMAAITIGPASAEAQECFVRGNAEGRPSPLDSVTVAMGGDEVKVCYGRPSARGRTLVGGDAHPHGSMWRAGANEATSIHIPFAATVAGFDVDPGSYSLYTVPGEGTWEVMLSSNWARWGVPINNDVTSANVGSGSVQATSNDHTEQLTFTFEDASSDSATLVLAWESYRVEIPITRR